MSRHRCLVTEILTALSSHSLLRLLSLVDTLLFSAFTKLSSVTFPYKWNYIASGLCVWILDLALTELSVVECRCGFNGCTILATFGLLWIVALAQWSTCLVQCILNVKCTFCKQHMVDLF